MYSHLAKHLSVAVRAFGVVALASWLVGERLYESQSRCIGPASPLDFPCGFVSVAEAAGALQERYLPPRELSDRLQHETQLIRMNFVANARQTRAMQVLTTHFSIKNTGSSCCETQAVAQKKSFRTFPYSPSQKPCANNATGLIRQKTTTCNKIMVMWMWA